MEKTSVEIFRASLSDFLDKVFFLKQTFLVTRNGAPYVIVGPVSSNNGSIECVHALEIRKNVAKVLGQVHYQDKSILVLRYGKPVAMLSGLTNEKASNLS